MPEAGPSSTSEPVWFQHPKPQPAPVPDPMSLNIPGVGIYRPSPSPIPEIHQPQGPLTGADLINPTALYPNQPEDLLINPIQAGLILPPPENARVPKHRKPRERRANPIITGGKLRLQVATPPAADIPPVKNAILPPLKTGMPPGPLEARTSLHINPTGLRIPPALPTAITVPAPLHQPGPPKAGVIRPGTIDPVTSLLIDPIRPADRPVNTVHLTGVPASDRSASPVLHTAVPAARPNPVHPIPDPALHPDLLREAPDHPAQAGKNTKSILFR